VVASENFTAQVVYSDAGRRYEQEDALLKHTTKYK
jgi:hypothetical protein